MKLKSVLKFSAAALCLSSGLSHAAGMLPETSVVVVEQAEGEKAMNVKNTDDHPVLMLTTLQNIKGDDETLLAVTPPAARVEAGKTQRVRFIVVSDKPLKTERLKRVIFEGVPPQAKGETSQLRMTVRQNLPVLIRPAGLAKDPSPWKHLTWQQKGNSITVSNPSAYVVRLGQSVQTLPDNLSWTLPDSFILPGQTLNISPDNNKQAGQASKVRISPATTWGYSVDTYEADLKR